LLLLYFNDLFAKNILMPLVTQRMVAIACVLLLPLVTVVYGNYWVNDNSMLRVWSFTTWCWLLPAIPFLWWQHTLRLPDVATFTVRLWKPFVVGVAFGIADVLIIKGILHPQPYDSLPPFLQPFPYSILLYTAGAIEVEVYYRLIPLGLALWGIQKWVHARWQTFAFTIVAVFTALREPLEQWPDGVWWFVCYALGSGFVMNLIQAMYFKNQGFWATLLLRLGHYSIWHIALGLYVQYVELAR
jgi:hypothetical protein